MNKKIMVIDDDQKLLRTIKMVLDAADYNAECFDNAIEAIEHLKKTINSGEEYDLILSDMNMPFITGRELISQVLEIVPSVPLWIITGQTCLELELLKKAGQIDIIEKPFGAKFLIAKVDNLFKAN